MVTPSGVKTVTALKGCKEAKAATGVAATGKRKIPMDIRKLIGIVTAHVVTLQRFNIFNPSLTLPTFPPSRLSP
jgi:hypothetical protein